MSFSSFADQWKQLNDCLLAHRRLWQPTPFTQPQPPWTLEWPALAERVAGFSDDGCRQLEQDLGALAEIVSESVPALAEMPRLTSVPALTDLASAEFHTLPEVLARDMPGRKRIQSGAFTAAIQPLNGPITDWCCGKGHLARTLSQRCDHPVRGLEWNPALVEDGNRLARKFADEVFIHCQDVMAEDLNLPDTAHGVALHACGDLHRRLLMTTVRQSLPRLSLAPCCFHLSEHSEYRPLSSRAGDRRMGLALATADLKLAVEETVTAPSRVRDQVQKFSQWRLGFDGLQRQLRGVDQYLPVPSHPGWVARGDFREFCRWAADRKGILLPASVDYPAWQAHGVARLGQVRRHELVRHLFRRPLELWLVLDYALFLEEQGYRVRLGTFCARSLTPRNLLVDAVMGD